MQPKSQIVTVEIKKSDGETFEFHPESDRKFRLVCFNDEDIRVFGKMPLKLIRRPFREFAEAWVAEHAYELKVILEEYIPDFKPEALRKCLEEAKHGMKLSCEQKHGKRDGAVVFSMMWDFLRAIAIKLKKSVENGVIQWEIESLPNNGGVYRILLEGGRDEESVDYNQGE
jgi:hypothetical protein